MVPLKIQSKCLQKLVQISSNKVDSRSIRQKELHNNATTAKPPFRTRHSCEMAHLTTQTICKQDPSYYTSLTFITPTKTTLISTEPSHLKTITKCSQDARTLHCLSDPACEDQSQYPEQFLDIRPWLASPRLIVYRSSKRCKPTGSTAKVKIDNMCFDASGFPKSM